MKFLTAILLALLVYPAVAGPPEGMVPETIPLHVMCLPSTVDSNHFATVVGALTNDYAVHVSMTFTANAVRKVAIVENPDTTLAGILLITPHGTCVAFSGRDAQHFDRPAGIKPPEVDINEPEDKGEVES